MTLSTDVKRRRHFQAFCNNKRIKMKSNVLYRKNKGLTVDEYSEKVKNTEVVEPDIVLASQSSLFPQKEAALKIIEYKEEVRSSTPSKRITDDQLLEKIQITNVTTQHMVEQNTGQLKTIAEKVEKVLENTTPKKRRTNKAQILRDPVPKTMLEIILQSPRPKACHRLSWSRFLVTSTLLYFTGLRVSELACVTEDMIQQIVDDKEINFYQPKVNQYRKIRFTDVAVERIKKVFDENKDILFEKNSVIYPVENSKAESTEKFTKSINKYLKIFNTEHNKKITSHLFRVAYVTNLLKYAPAHMAQKLIGHADIRSTMKYSRYELDPETTDSILKQMFD